MPNNQASFLPQSVFPGMVPCKGLKDIPVKIDFSLGVNFTLDLSQIQSLGYFECVQTVYVDNVDSTYPLYIRTSTNTNQRITVPPGAWAYVPVLQSNPASLVFSSASGLQIMVQLLNFYIPPCVGQGTAQFTFSGGVLQVADAILDGTVVNNQVQTRGFPGAVNLTDGSGTITLGGTAQVLFAANAARNRFIISNPSNATEVLQFMFNTGGSGPISLLPGMTWDENGSTCCTGAIYIVAATTAHAFTAYQG